MPTYRSFQIVVYRNGEEFPAIDASFSRTLSQGTISWSITTAGPIDDLDLANDVWSLALSVEGKTWYRFDSCVAESAELEDSTSSGSVTITGTYKLTTNELMNYCAPKTIVFVNQEWLTDVFGSWCVQEGVLRYKHPRVRGGRLYHPRLPGKEFTDDLVDFKVGSWTHHSIARYLANLVGCDLIVTTPDIDLMDTFTISSGTTWFDAIKANFTMWGPNISIEAGSTQSARPCIYILDVIHSSGGITPVGTITIDAESVDSISHEQSETGTSSDKVDQVVITGREGPSTTFSEFPDFTTIKIPVKEWAPNCVVENTTPMSDITCRKELGEYEGSFGLGDDVFTVSMVEKFNGKYEYYRYQDASGGENDLLLKETHDTTDKTGQVVHRIVTEHKYGADKQPVRTIEREYLYCNFPGSPQKQLRHVKNKITSQEYYVVGLKQSLTAELVEEMVVCDTVSKGGVTYRDNANPLHAIKRIDRTRSYIDKTTRTSQIIFPMTTHFSRTFISRTAEGTLIKRKLDYDVIAGTGKMDSQLLKNPKEQQSTSSGQAFRREYFDGDGVTIGDYQCYRKATTVSHPDITTDEIAEALADRVFYRRSDDIETMTVKTSMPIPIGSLPVKAIVSSTVKQVASSTALTPASRTSNPGGEYFVNALSEKFTVQNADDPSIATLKVEQTLTLVSRL